MALSNEIQLRIDTLTNNVETAKSVAELKKAYKDLKSAAIEYADKNEEAFNQVQAAAGKANDKMTDINNSIKSLSGEPIENLGASIDLTSNSLKSLDFGSTTQGLKNLSSSIKGFNFGTIKEGIQGVSSAFKELGATLLANPIFLVAAIIIAVGVALYELKDIIPGVGAAFAAIGDAIKAVIKVITDFTDAMGLTAVAANKKAEDTIKNNDRETEAITKRYEKEIQLAKDSNKSVVALEYAKLEALSKQAGAQVKAYEVIKKNHGKLTDDEKKEYEKSVNNFKAAEDAKVLYLADTQKKIMDLQRDLNNEVEKGRIALMADGAAKTAATIKEARKESDEKLAIERKDQLETARISAEGAERQRQITQGLIENQYLINKAGLDAVEKLKRQYAKKDEEDRKLDQKQINKSFIDEDVASKQRDINRLKRQESDIKNTQGISDEERKNQLIANLAAQSIEYDRFYEKQKNAAQGNATLIGQIEDAKLDKKKELENAAYILEKDYKEKSIKDNDDYWTKYNIEGESAYKKELDDLEAKEKAKKELLINNSQMAIDLDQMELDRLYNKNSLKFGAEMDLINKIHDEKLKQINVEKTLLDEKYKNDEISKNEYDEKIKDINEKNAVAIKQLDLDTAEAKKQANLKAINEIAGFARAGMEAASGLADIAEQSENQRLKKGEKASLEVQKKQFNRRKALGIVNAIISTAEGISKAVAESPETGGLPGSAIAALVGGIQIAKISGQKFQGDSGSSGSEGGSVATPTVPSQGASQTLANAGRPAPFFANTDMTFGSNAPKSNKSGGGVDRVVVLDYNDVRAAATRAQVREGRSTL